MADLAPHIIALLCLAAFAGGLFATYGSLTGHVRGVHDLKITEYRDKYGEPTPVERAWNRTTKRALSLAPRGPLPDFVDEVGWLLEELRVSLFAQSLGTTVPVSEKRVRSAVAKAAERLR